MRWGCLSRAPGKFANSDTTFDGMHFTIANQATKICSRMNLKPFIPILSCCSALLGANQIVSADESFMPPATKGPGVIDMAQVPSWSRADLDFFLHGSMGTEVVPEPVLRAFIHIYPDLFPKDDLSNLGAIPDAKFGWPIGFSRKNVPHLGGLSAVGVNCASCHVGEITPPDGVAPGGMRVLGMTSQFDAEGFLGAVMVSTFRTADPANLKKFLAAYLAVNDPKSGDHGQRSFVALWQQQEQKITSAMTAYAMMKTANGLRPIKADDLRLDGKSLARGKDLAGLSVVMLDLFHNMRFALHVPDQPPPASPPNGPGRNDPWRLLAYSLLGVVTEPAPVKFGIVWNEDQRAWVHDDGNTHSPVIRNLAASLGLGAPLIGHHGELDFALLKRQTDLSQRIRPPRYPWAIDQAAAGKGAKIYATDCASCHDGPQTDERLHAIAEIQTDPNRAMIFTQPVADGFNRFFAQLEIAGYTPPESPPLRSTQKYWSPSLAGVWARSPYLHNGSVRTLQELLAPPAARAKNIPSRLAYLRSGADGLHRRRRVCARHERRGQLQLRPRLRHRSFG